MKFGKKTKILLQNQKKGSMKPFDYLNRIVIVIFVIFLGYQLYTFYLQQNQSKKISSNTVLLQHNPSIKHSKNSPTKPIAVLISKKQKTTPLKATNTTTYKKTTSTITSGSTLKSYNSQKEQPKNSSDFSQVTPPPIPNQKAPEKTQIKTAS